MPFMTLAIRESVPKSASTETRHKHAITKYEIAMYGRYCVYTKMVPLYSDLCSSNAVEGYNRSGTFIILE